MIRDSTPITRSLSLSPNTRCHSLLTRQNNTTVTVGVFSPPFGFFTPPPPRFRQQNAAFVSISSPVYSALGSGLTLNTAQSSPHTEAVQAVCSSHQQAARVHRLQRSLQYIRRNILSDKNHGEIPRGSDGSGLVDPLHSTAAPVKHCKIFRQCKTLPVGGRWGRGKNCCQ